MRNTVSGIFTVAAAAVLLPAVAAGQSPPVPSLPPASPGPTADARPVVACPVPGAASTEPGTPAASAVWEGAWEPMPTAPIGARSGAATDFAMQERGLYVWGGRDADGELLNDGAVFLVSEQRWEPLPATDLVPRERFGFDSDGRGITIWGGIDADGVPLADGARLVLADDDRTMRWQALPEAPLTPGPASLSGDVNITYAVTPGAAAGDPPRFAVLDTDNRTDSLAWDDPSSPNRRLHGGMPAPRVPSGVAYEIAAVNDSALLISYQADGSAIGSWFTEAWPGTWSTPAAVPLPATAGCPALGLPRLGWVRAAPDGSVVGYLTRASGNGAFRPTPAAPHGTATGGMLVWSPSRLIMADALLAYDIVARQWAALPPLPDGPRNGMSAAWSGGSLYLWGGLNADGQPSDTGWVFTPDPPVGLYPLPGGFVLGGDCGGEGDPSSARIRADESDPDLVWLKLEGRRIQAVWPEGYSVRFGDEGAEIIAPDGTVVAREGQRLSATSLKGCMTGDRILLE